MTMYPLLLTPHVTDYLWGGTRLKTEYGYPTDKDIAAEAWVLSCHKDGASVVQNGEFAGKTLPEVLALWGDDAIGARAAAFPYFPLLIKLIDAKDRLSVQVHPDNEYALRVEGEFGKTEMWYVVDCDEGAELIYGFNTTLTQEELRAQIEADTLPDVCNFVPVKKGDVFFIPSGTIHAIGAGLLVAEVQQNSNITYRMWDYGRIGADGKPRELHIEKGLDVTVREHRGPTLPYEPDREVPGGRVRHLVRCERFCVDVIHLCGLIEDYAAAASFVSLLCLEGEGALLWGESAMPLKKGQSVFVPAGLGGFKLAGMMEILRTTL